LDLEDRWGRAAVHYACIANNLVALRAIISLHKAGSKAYLEVHDMDGATPLYLAAHHAHPQVIRCLTALGTDVDAKDAHGLSALVSLVVRLLHTLLPEFSVTMATIGSVATSVPSASVASTASTIPSTGSEVKSSTSLRSFAMKGAIPSRDQNEVYDWRVTYPVVAFDPDIARTDKHQRPRVAWDTFMDVIRVLCECGADVDGFVAPHLRLSLCITRARQHYALKQSITEDAPSTSGWSVDALVSTLNYIRSGAIAWYFKSL